MRSIKPLLCSLLFLVSANLRADETATFDYWVLSLSWSPQFCAEHSTDSGSYGFGSGNTPRQCDRPYAFVIHGLWPQNENGYPEDCSTAEKVDNAMADRMMPLMPDPQLVRHEWRMHGACSGLPMKDYFLTVESVYRSFVIPDVYQDPRQYVTTNALDLKREFMNANRKLNEDQFVLECSGRFLREIRVCYDKDFHFRACGDDLKDRCRNGDIVLRPRR